MHALQIPVASRNILHTLRSVALMLLPTHKFAGRPFSYCLSEKVKKYQDELLPDGMICVQSYSVYNIDACSWTGEGGGVDGRIVEHIFRRTV